MIKHIEFTSDCKRIAKEIMNAIIGKPSDAHMISDDKFEVIVSGSLLKAFNAQEKQYMKGINKNLKEYSVQLDTVGYGHGYFILFKIEYDDNKETL